MHSVVRPQDPDSDNEITDDEEEWTAISYQTVCESLDIGIGGTKLDHTLKTHFQAVDMLLM